MSVINFTNITQADQLLGIANTTTGGSYWVAVLFMIFIVLLILFMSQGWEVAILGSSFICLIIGLFLTYMELIAFKWVLFFIGMLIFFFMYIVYKSR